MNNSIFQFDIGESIIFHNGLWKIESLSKKIKISKGNYTIPLSFYELYNGIWIEKNKINLHFKDNEQQSFRKIENFNFQIRIISIGISINSHINIEIEINYLNDGEDIKCVICSSHKINYTYVNREIYKHFCSEKCLYIDGKTKRDDDDNMDKDDSDDDDDEEKKIVKKQRIEYKKKKLEILFIALDHGEKEMILDKHLLNCLNSYSKDFNSMKLNNKNRKPFIVFWEQTVNVPNEINISDIDGKGTASWNLPVDTDLIASFTFMESAFEGFLKPVHYYPDGKSDGGTESVGGYHGFYKPDFDKYGYDSPITLEIAVTFLLWFFRDILSENLSNYNYIETLIPSTKLIITMIQDIRQIWIDMVEENRSNLISIYKDIVEKEINELDNEDEKKETREYLFKKYFPQDNNILFTLKDHGHILDTIHTKFNFKSEPIRKKIEEVIKKYWMLIAIHANKDKITYPLNIDFIYNINHHRIVDYINRDYFINLFIELKKTADIPTVLFSNFMESIISKNRIKPALITEFRNLISTQIITDVCLNTKIERCIVLYGHGHIKHLKNQFRKDEEKSKDTQDEITYKFTVYKISYITNLNFTDEYHRRFRSSKEDELKKFGEYTDIIRLYCMLEKIDEWLLITDHDYPYALKTFEQTPSYKLQYWSKINSITDQGTKQLNELEEIFMVYFNLYILQNTLLNNESETVFSFSSNSLLNKIITTIKDNGVKLNRKIGYSFDRIAIMDYDNTDFSKNTYRKIKDFIMFIDEHADEIKSIM